GTALDRVVQRDGRDLEAAEELADIENVVDRQNEPSLERRQAVGHHGELIAAEEAGAIVALAAQVRRVEVEQRGRPVVAIDERQPIQVLDDDAGQALVQLGEHGAELVQVERTGRPRIHAEVATGNLAAECGTLQVEEPAGALEI